MSRTLMTSERGLSARVACIAALALAVLATLCLAPRADAAFTLGKCAGEDIAGNGSSFANNAHNFVFKPSFKDTYCADTPFAGAAAPVLTYTGNGSGAGRAAMMERAGASRFAGTDEPPTPIDIQRMETGVGKTGNPAEDPDPSDNGEIHVIPAAIGAVAPLVNWPDACDVMDLPAESRTEEQNLDADETPDDVVRVRFTRAQFEGIWSGAAGFKTWNQVFPSLNAHCANVPIIRVVRFDNSGTTFALKDYLDEIDQAEGWDEQFTFGATDTRGWPNAAAVGPREDCPKVNEAFPVGPGADSTEATSAGPDQLTSGCAEGGGQLVNKVNATDGSVGYADIATARGASPSFAITPETNDNDKYWMQLPDGGAGNGVFREPTADPNGFRAEGTKGANCAGAEFTNEGNPLPTSLGDWAKVSGVNSPGAFPTCTLTYGLLFDDDADVWGGGATEEALARTVKDYWENAVRPSTQSALTSRDYGPLPNAIEQIAKEGVAEIGWEKGPAGGGGGEETPPPSGGDKPGGNPPPPVIPISNKFSLVKKTVSSSNGGASVSVKIPGPGKVELVGTAKVGAGASASKSLKVGRTVLNADKAGTYSIALKPSAAAKKVLREEGKLKVSLKLTYTPTGGTPSASTSALTLKLSKGK